MEDSKQDEIYTEDAGNTKQAGSGRLGEDELDKLQKEFFNAIRSVNISLVEDFINKYQKDYNLINRCDREGGRQTSLFLSVILQDREACNNISRMLIMNGANVIHKDSYNQTPLFYVARDGKIELMRLFLEKGANVNETDDYNQTPIFYASREGHADTVKFMVEHGADIHHLDKNAENCLFYACSEGRIDVVKFLIEKGINVNQVDNMKQTALFFAKRKGHHNVVEALGAAGAQTNKNGRATKKDAARSIKGGNQPTQEATSKVSVSQSASHLNKRKKEKEKSRTACRIIFTDKKGNSRELSTEEWEKFKTENPKVAAFIENPDSIPRDLLEEEANMETWESVASQILNNIWKMRGAQIFHKPVDPIKLGIPDYTHVIKEPMDLSTIKVGVFLPQKKLNHNVYENLQEWIIDMDLVFSNCKKYNGVHTDVGQIGVSCQNEFIRLLDVYGVKERFAGEANGHGGETMESN